MKNLKTHKNFSGKTQFWSHESKSTGTEMKFSTFIPEAEIRGCLIWLSGLTCTEENFITKASAQKFLAKHKLMVIAPDTSPRGLHLPGEHESYDFGSGAGFYVDALTEGYKDHYRMYSYVNEELYEIVRSQFGAKKVSIFGHSMGGHGALVLGLKNPSKYQSISAFSPIVHPSVVPWGEKAFMGYLGPNKSTWMEYDACELLKAGKSHPQEILIHQGTEDEFLEKQLRPQDFENTAREFHQKHKIVMAPGYDHSYYFISTFMEDHIAHHAQVMA